MSIPTASEEMALRRRLLFRLLRKFDFDAPRFAFERISEPVPKTLLDHTADEFVWLNGDVTGASKSVVASLYA